MLVLVATLSSALSSLVEEKEVFTLLRRTIKFLKRHEHLSPTLRYDRGVLEHIQARLSEADASQTISLNRDVRADVSPPWDANISPALGLTNGFPDLEFELPAYADHQTGRVEMMF